MAGRSTGLPPGLDPYRTLQVVPEADPEVIQAAYRRLARKFHPDVAPGSDAAARMVAINASWEVLRDPARRAAYDRSRVAADHAATRKASTTEHAPSTGRRSTPPPSATPRSTTASAKARSSWGPDAPRPAGASEAHPGESVSRDWTSGRSTVGGGYDPATMRAPDGTGAAGPPPGSPSGSVLSFGRYTGWSLGEIARTDVDYLEWLDRASIGRQYRPELDAILRRLGRRRAAASGETGDRGRGLFRRR